MRNAVVTRPANKFAAVGGVRSGNVLAGHLRNALRFPPYARGLHTCPRPPLSRLKTVDRCSSLSCSVTLTTWPSDLVLTTNRPEGVRHGSAPGQSGGGNSSQQTRRQLLLRSGSHYIGRMDGCARPGCRRCRTGNTVVNPNNPLEYLPDSQLTAMGFTVHHPVEVINYPDEGYANVFDTRGACHFASPT